MAPEVQGAPSIVTGMAYAADSVNGVIEAASPIREQLQTAHRGATVVAAAPWWTLEGAFRNIFNNAFSAFVNILGAVLAAAARALTWILNNASKILEQETAKDLWGMVRNYVNYLLILILIVASVFTILRIDTKNYSLSRILPGIVWAALLTNFSYLIVQALIGVADIFTLVFLGKVNEAGAFDALGTLLSDSAINAANSSAGAAWSTTGSVVNALITLIGFIIGMLVAALAFSFLALLWLARTAVLYVLLITSPIMFALNIVPATQGYVKRWWEAFRTWVLFGPISAFFIFLAYTTLYGAASSALRNAANLSNSSLLIFILLFSVMLFYAAYIPLTQAGPLGKQAAGLLQKWVGGNLGKAASWAGKTGLQKGATLAAKPFGSLYGGISRLVAPPKDAVGEGAWKRVFTGFNKGWIETKPLQTFEGLKRVVGKQIAKGGLDEKKEITKRTIGVAKQGQKLFKTTQKTKLWQDRAEKLSAVPVLGAWAASAAQSFEQTKKAYEGSALGEIGAAAKGVVEAGLSPDAMKGMIIAAREANDETQEKIGMEALRIEAGKQGAGSEADLYYREMKTGPQMTSILGARIKGEIKPEDKDALRIKFELGRLVGYENPSDTGYFKDKTFESLTEPEKKKLGEKKTALDKTGFVPWALTEPKEPPKPGEEGYDPKKTEEYERKKKEYDDKKESLKKILELGGGEIMAELDSRAKYRQGHLGTVLEVADFIEKNKAFKDIEVKIPKKDAQGNEFLDEKDLQTAGRELKEANPLNPMAQLRDILDSSRTANSSGGTGFSGEELTRITQTLDDILGVLDRMYRRPEEGGGEPSPGIETPPPSGLAPRANIDNLLDAIDTTDSALKILDGTLPQTSSDSPDDLKQVEERRERLVKEKEKAEDQAKASFARTYRVKVGGNTSDSEINQRFENLKQARKDFPELRADDFIDNQTQDEKFSISSTVQVTDIRGELTDENTRHKIMDEPIKRSRDGQHMYLTEEEGSREAGDLRQKIVFQHQLRPAPPVLGGEGEAPSGSETPPTRPAPGEGPTPPSSGPTTTPAPAPTAGPVIRSASEVSTGQVASPASPRPTTSSPTISPPAPEVPPEQPTPPPPAAPGQATPPASSPNQRTPTPGAGGIQENLGLRNQSSPTPPTEEAGPGASPTEEGGETGGETETGNEEETNQ